MKFLIFLVVVATLLQVNASFAEPDSCVPPHAVILIYHHVSDDTPASTSLSPALFQEQLDFLAKNEFRVMDLPTVVLALRGGKTLPDSVVVFTFDDGYDSVYTEAFPRLKERGWPFTVFICPEAIDKQEGPVMTWDQLRELAASGGTIANHGLDHSFANRLQEGETQAENISRLEAEWLQARKRIKEETGQDEDLFAFAYGEYGPATIGLIEKLGWTGFGQQSGAAGPESDFTCLPRFPMAAGFAAMERFGEKVACLPFPLENPPRIDPNLTPGDEPPVLELKVNPDCLATSTVAAYASGQGAIECQWPESGSGQLQIQAGQPLPRGRSRYNVTAPVPGTRRWYWHSQVWIVGQEHGQ